MHQALSKIIRILAEIEADRLCSTTDTPKTDDEVNEDGSSRSQSLGEGDGKGEFECNNQ
jgi:hypothetical protein